MWFHTECKSPPSCSSFIPSQSRQPAGLTKYAQGRPRHSATGQRVQQGGEHAGEHAGEPWREETLHAHCPLTAHADDAVSGPVLGIEA